MSLFVLEIGSEELPARFLPVQEMELKNRFMAALEEQGVEHGGVRVMSTPRRAVVFIDAVQPAQREKEEVLTGPPLRAAYDSEGKPGKALEGFARTHGVELADIFTVQTEKGEYVAVKKRTGGAKAADLLAQICPAVIMAQPFAKRMRWGSHTLAYARPLRWILALLDAEVIPFSVGPVTSGRQTWGHRIHGKKNGSLVIDVPNAAAFLSTVREQGGVEPDSALRRAAIVASGNAQAAAVQGTVLWKDSLLEEVQGLGEHSVPLLGHIDPAFLEVPREVLLTSMESHQKSFGVEGKDGQLLPHFLTVLNLSPVDTSVVRKGWERVLRARLEDARFFWRSDLSSSFDTWLHKLDTVIFLGPLGSMGDKTRRLEKLCAWLAEQCGADATLAARAGRLSKADLVSGMVGEFDTLQGIMGGIYATRMGEDKVVAEALAEQYLPAGPDSSLPNSRLGALLSLADKADTLVGCFGLGMIPTGTADPNALRRCALGITRIILDLGLRLDVRALFAKAQELYGQRQWKLAPEESLTKLEEFFAARLKNYWTSPVGGSAEVLLVDAVLNAGSRDVWAAGQRLAALQELHAGPRYTEAVQTFKRASNIVRKQGQEEALSGKYTATLLQEDAEKALAAVLDTALPRFDQLWAEDKFADIYALLLELRPAVDSFFEGVMVICEDAALRQNRLNMLKALTDRMSTLADFAALQV